FLVSQFAVFGPVVFGAFLVVIVRLFRPGTPREDKLLLAFSLPVLALITIVGFTTRAHPNWAAPAFISGAIVVTAAMVRDGSWRWITAGLAIGVFAQGVLLVTDTMADRVRVPLISKPDVYERTMGWRSLGDETLKVAARAGAKTIV